MKPIIDIFSGKMNYLTTAEKLDALQAWKELPYRPAYAYPSSELADRLGFGSGCWFVEGRLPGHPCNDTGYLTKAEAYAAAGILAHVIEPGEPEPKPTRPKYNVDSFDERDFGGEDFRADGGL